MGILEPRQAVLLLGGNSKNTLELFHDACQQLGQQGVRILRQSSVYKSEAWGFESDRWFLNQALLIQTSSSPQELLAIVLSIEKKLGRERQGQGYSSRSIDIDILFFEQLVLDTPALKLPHPLLHQRRFSLVPLAEILPSLVHPVLKKSILQLLDECNDKGEVQRL